MDKTAKLPKSQRVKYDLFLLMKKNTPKISVSRQVYKKSCSDVFSNNGTVCHGAIKNCNAKPVIIALITTRMHNRVIEMAKNAHV